MEIPKFFPKSPNQSVKSTSFHNLLKRKFNPDEPNRIWVSDITYLKVGSFLEERNVVQSFPPKPVHNAVLDAFFKFLKAKQTVDIILPISLDQYNLQTILIRESIVEYS